MKKFSTCKYAEIANSFEEKNIFLTASSHLIEEIMRQYKDMDYQILTDHKKGCEYCKEHLNLEKEDLEDNLDA